MEDKTPQKPEQTQQERDEAQDAARGPAFAAALGNGIGAYSGGAKPALDLSDNRWELEKKHNATRMWNQSPQGRLAIRSLSRGVLGAAFFAGGQRYANAKMASYHPERAAENWVQLIAKVYNKAIGKPIEMTVNALGYDGKRAVTFRPTRKFYGGTQDGRDYGHEVVGVTFDFASMSVGDALGRDLIGIFDPNAKLSWIKDGHIDYPQGIRSMAMSAWRIMSYNQGEDWAAGIIYPYFLRGQRNVINKFSPGFGYDSDRNLNGGSFKVNDHGKVVGNYNAEGMLDLQGRFTAYNILTLMFREAYTEAADLYYKKSEQDKYALPDPMKEPGGFINKLANNVKHVVRWAARDAVKGTMYMTPAMPFFWATRTPQTKYRGMFIHPEKGVVAYKSGPQSYPLGVDVVHTNEERRRTNLDRPEEWKFSKDTETFFSNFNSRAASWQREPGNIPNPLVTNGPDFTGYNKTFGVMDSAFNGIGKWNNKIRKHMHHNVYALRDRFGFDVDKFHGKRFSDTFVNASISYTPYFWSKAEFARLWDNARMDQSIERTLDGAAALNGGEFTGGLGDVWNTLRFKPLENPEHEANAQHRIQHDVSPSDIFDPLIFQPGHRGHAAAPSVSGIEGDVTSAVAAEPARPVSMPAPDPMMSEPYLRSARKAGVIERIYEHKAHAQNRMEQFKGRQQPASFAEAVKTQRDATPAAAPAEAADTHTVPSSFLEKEKQRQAGQQPDMLPNSTLH